MSRTPSTVRSTDLEIAPLVVAELRCAMLAASRTRTDLRVNGSSSVARSELAGDRPRQLQQHATAPRPGAGSARRGGVRSSAIAARAAKLSSEAPGRRR